MKKNTIEITSIDRKHSFIENIKGILYIEKIGSINFEIFRPVHMKSKFHLRVYNKRKSVLIDNFGSGPYDNFMSYEYDNRKMIIWIAENAERLVTAKGPE